MGTGSLFVAAWGSLTVGAPVLAWGLAACAIPVLVHLVLRQRPRRQVFPAMRLLAQSLRSATRARRLRQWLLLLTRMLVIALMVAGLMKLGCVPDRGSATATWLGPADEPVSAVICLDDSASMGYRFQGRTRLDHARSWAADLLQQPHRFPPGSQVAIVLGSSDQQPTAWAADLAAARRQLDLAQVRDHDRPVAGLLRQAYALLDSARHRRREVYLFNDLTQHSWRQPPPPPPEAPSALYVLDVGQAENRNAALAVPQMPTHVLPASRPAGMTFVVRSGDEPVEPVVKLIVDGQLRDRLAPDRLDPNSETYLSVTMPPMEEGTHGVTITLEPADALDCDNRRFLAVSVGPPSQVTVVAGRANDEVATLIAAMIAPPSLPAGQHPCTVQSVSTDRLADRQTFSNALAVFLADVDRLDAAYLETLGDYVRSGGVLVVVPGPNATRETYALLAPLLPAAVEAIKTCPEPLRLAATEFNHPFLQPFADPATDSINDRMVFKRLVLAQAPADATTIAPFADQRPALLARPMGRGRVILLAFSPARDWGQFGSQAAPMIVLLHTILAELTPPAANIASFTAGQPALRRTSELGGEPLLVRRPDDHSPSPLPARDGLVRLPTEQASEYQVLAGQPEQRPVLHCAVNVADGESDPRRLAPEQIQGRFPAPGVLLVQDASMLAAPRASATAPRNLTIAAGLMLLMLLLAESRLANRSYASAAHNSTDT